MLHHAGFAVIAMLIGQIAAPNPGAPHRFACYGEAKQGGLLVCRVPAGSMVLVSDETGNVKREVPVNHDGLATIGLGHTEMAVLRVGIKGRDDFPIQTIHVASRTDPVRTITGFDCDKIDARTPEQKRHAAESWQIKQRAFGVFAVGQGARNGFISPVKEAVSSPFGATRKYVGYGKDGKVCEKTSVHYGYDFAVPSGTPVQAPAAGVVTLSENNLYYEGGTVFLDHGDGLVSVFMHMARVDVKTGQSVTQGQFLGLSGNTGRTSGPHLHWGVKWRNAGSERRGQDFYVDPALLLELAPIAGLPEWR